MKWARPILLLLFVWANSQFAYAFYENRGELYPPFSMYSNLIVTHQLLGGQDWTKSVAGGQVYRVDQKVVRNRADLREAFRASNRGRVTIEFRMWQSGQTRFLRKSAVPLEPLTWQTYLNKTAINILAANLFLFFAWFFFRNTQDKYFFSVFTVLAFVYAIVTRVTWFDDGWFLYYMCLFTGPAAIFNLALSIGGRDTSRKLLTGQILASAVFAGVATGIYEKPEGFHFSFDFFLIYSLFHISAGAAYLIYRFFRPGSDREMRERFLAFGLVIWLGFAIPVIIFYVSRHGELSYLRTYMAPLVMLTPLVIIVVNFRYQLIPLRALVNQYVIYIVVLSVISLIYATVIFLYNYFLPVQAASGSEMYLHGLFILILVFLLDPIQSWISRIFKQEIFRREAELAEALQDMALLVSNPGRVEKTIPALLERLKRAVDLRQASLMLPPSVFPRLAEDPPYILRTERNNPVWQILRRTRNPLVWVHHWRSGPMVNREAYRYLDRLRFQFLIPLNVEKSGEMGCLLVSGKKGRGAFNLEEAKFLRRSAHLVNLLFENYYYQMADLEKRRRERELQLSFRIQKALVPPNEVSAGPFQIRSFSFPAVGVTGDYIDIFPLDRDNWLILMGDVAGHGLGAAYLMAASRSLARLLFRAGRELPGGLNEINDFLMNRYGGYEFMTMFALRLNLPDGKIEYVNAGHPFPFLYRHSADRLTPVKNSQLLLGVVATDYTSHQLRLEPGDRLFLYSDGIQDLCNPAGESFGENRFQKFLRDTIRSEKSGDLPQLLVDKLNRFRKKSPWTDDTSFVEIRLPAGSDPLTNRKYENENNR